MLRLRCPQRLSAKQKMTHAPFCQSHQSWLTFLAVFRDFPHDAKLALLEVNILKLELPDFAAAASCANGDCGAVHRKLPILVCQSSGDENLDLLLSCYFAGAVFHLTQPLISRAKFFRPTISVGHHTSQKEQLIVHGSSCHRLAHGTADVFSALLLIVANMGEGNCIDPKLCGK